MTNFQILFFKCKLDRFSVIYCFIRILFFCYLLREKFAKKKGPHPAFGNVEDVSLKFNSDRTLYISAIFLRENSWPTIHRRKFTAENSPLGKFTCPVNCSFAAHNK